MFNPHDVRPRFPALARAQEGTPVVYLDGPGGTQTPATVIDAMAGVLERGISNLGGGFAASRDADEVTMSARRAVADLINAKASEIAFGQNMTSLTFAISRALSRTWQPGDQIVVTRLDHDANITPWVMAAEEKGVIVRWLDFLPERGHDLDYAALDELLTPQTRLVAVTHASNALGTIVDVPRVVQAAHAVGARVFVDAVHYTPHRLLDVQTLDCDFLVASAYKFFGPHTGFLYGRQELLAELDAYKVRPAPTESPGKWETGTQSFESLAGVTAAVDYLASLGGRNEPGGDRRKSIEGAFGTIEAYEAKLTEAFLAAIDDLPGVSVHGPTVAGALRTPTFAVEVAGLTPNEVQHALSRRGIYVWAGHYYAVEVMRRLGVLEKGGLVRIGFVHYNTADELTRVVEALGELRSGF